MAICVNVFLGLLEWIVMKILMIVKLSLASMVPAWTMSMVMCVNVILGLLVKIVLNKLTSVQRIIARTMARV